MTRTTPRRPGSPSPAARPRGTAPIRGSAPAPAPGRGAQHWWHSSAACARRRTGRAWHLAVPPRCHPASPGAALCPRCPPRLLRELAEKEQEWQQLVQRALRSGVGDATVPSLPRHRGEHGEATAGQGPLSPSPEPADPLLLEWLQQHGTDPATTATVRLWGRVGLCPVGGVGQGHGGDATWPPSLAAPVPRLHPAGPAGQRHPRRPLLHGHQVPPGVAALRGGTRLVPGVPPNSPVSPSPGRRGPAYRLWAAVLEQRRALGKGGAEPSPAPGTRGGSGDTSPPPVPPREGQFGDVQHGGGRLQRPEQ